MKIELHSLIPVRYTTTPYEISSWKGNLWLKLDAGECQKFKAKDDTFMDELTELIGTTLHEDYQGVSVNEWDYSLQEMFDGCMLSAIPRKWDEEAFELDEREERLQAGWDKYKVEREDSSES